MSTEAYEIVAGLEVHVELATKSKIFCGCTTEFGGEPNTHVCPVCLGLPGTLPVLNRQVVEFAVRTGLALDCAITPTPRFDRKNYFYPDLPKAYQVSQLYLPICRNGSLKLESGKVIGIHEIHMEEDAGKLIHDPWDDCTLVDYNRGGVPLLEIVSEPDFRSAAEVVDYLERLREILVYLGVSDCKMQEGSMRADVNLSVRKPGQPLGTRTEMKNMNSFKAIFRAVEGEARRQIELLEAGGTVVQETRRWDDNKGASFSMRTKEDAQDYRYFPEPDLPPMAISEEWTNRVQSEMPELPEAKRLRYVKADGLTEYDAKTLTAFRETAFLYEDVARLSGQPKEAANLIMTELMRLLTDTSTLPENLKVDPQKMADLIGFVVEKKINRNTAKAVFEEIFMNDTAPAAYIEANGLAMVEDDGLVAETVDRILKENTKSIEDYKGGKEKAFGFLVGQVMRALRGKANPQAVNRILQEKLDAIP